MAGPLGVRRGVSHHRGLDAAQVLQRGHVPYPSGELHRPRPNYTYIDLITRYKMMQGFNVLSPMGWDSFGLPAENLAIETGIHIRGSASRLRSLG